MQTRYDVADIQPVLSMLFIGTIFISLLPTPGTSDVLFWIEWSKNLWTHGIVEGYKLNQDVYPPLYSIFLLTASWLSELGDISIFFGLKITAFLALMATLFVIYHWSNKNFTLTFTYFIPLAYTSLALMYLGIFFAPFFLLSLYMIKKHKIAIGILLFSIATFIKQFPLIILPYFSVYLLHLAAQEKHIAITPLRMTMLITATFGSMVALLYVIFGNAFFQAIFLGFQEENLTYQALNFNKIMTSLFPQIDHRHLSYLSITLFVSFFLSSLLVFATKQKKSFETFLLFCLIGHFSYFVFSKGVHENHLYLSLLLSICLVITNSRNQLLSLNIALIHSINLLFVYGITGVNLSIQPILEMYQTYESISAFQRDIQPINPSLWISGFNVVFFTVTWIFVIFGNHSQHKTPDTSTTS